MRSATRAPAARQAAAPLPSLRDAAARHSHLGRPFRREPVRVQPLRFHDIQRRRDEPAHLSVEVAERVAGTFPGGERATRTRRVKNDSRIEPVPLPPLVLVDHPRGVSQRPQEPPGNSTRAWRSPVRQFRGPAETSPNPASVLLLTRRVASATGLKVPAALCRAQKSKRTVRLEPHGQSLRQLAVEEADVASARRGSVGGAIAVPVEAHDVGGASESHEAQISAVRAVGVSVLAGSRNPLIDSHANPIAGNSRHTQQPIAAIRGDVVPAIRKPSRRCHPEAVLRSNVESDGIRATKRGCCWTQRGRRSSSSSRERHQKYPYKRPRSERLHAVPFRLSLRSELSAWRLILTPHSCGGHDARAAVSPEAPSRASSTSQGSSPSRCRDSCSFESTARRRQNTTPSMAATP